MRSATPEPVGTIRAGLGEGPIWQAAEDRLLWIDIRLERLYTTDPANGQTDWVALPGAAGSAALTDGPEVLLAIGQELLTMESGDKAPRSMAALPAGAVGRFNDGKPDPVGRFWVGTADPAGGADAALWIYDASHGFRRAVEGVSMSNGLGWSPDSQRFYYADSMTARVDVFDFETETGQLTDRRVLHQFPEGHLVDGLSVDADGRVWLAIWGQGCVVCIAPDGRIDRTIHLPTPLVTSCAWGGSDYRTLWITTANDDPADPLAGALFAVEPGGQGLPPNAVRLGA